MEQAPITEFRVPETPSTMSSVPGTPQPGPTIIPEIAYESSFCANCLASGHYEEDCQSDCCYCKLKSRKLGSSDGTSWSCSIHGLACRHRGLMCTKEVYLVCNPTPRIPRKAAAPLANDGPVRSRKVPTAVKTKPASPINKDGHRATQRLTAVKSAPVQLSGFRDNRYLDPDFIYKSLITKEQVRRAHFKLIKKEMKEVAKRHEEELNTWAKLRFNAKAVWLDTCDQITQF